MHIRLGDLQCARFAASHTVRCSHSAMPSLLSCAYRDTQHPTSAALHVPRLGSLQSLMGSPAMPVGTAPPLQTVAGARPTRACCIVATRETSQYDSLLARMAGVSVCACGVVHSVCMGRSCQCWWERVRMLTTTEVHVDVFRLVRRRKSEGGFVFSALSHRCRFVALAGACGPPYMCHHAKGGTLDVGGRRCLTMMSGTLAGCPTPLHGQSPQW